jgi:hypothetical protein
MSLKPKDNNIVTNMTIARQLFGKHCLKAGTVETERTAIASQRFGKHGFGNDRLTTVQGGGLYSILPKL